MKILVTGVSGFVGSYLASGLRERHTIVGTFNRGGVRAGVGRAAMLDLRDEGKVIRLVLDESPDVIVHCAAMSKVSQCESNKMAAEEVNARAVGFIAAAASSVESRLIYLSTDLVFDGRKGMYSEDDKPRPLSIYAETKMIGENIAKSRCARTIVARFALCYGWGSRPETNFTHWMIRELEEGRQVKVFTDQYRTPFYVDAASAIVEKLMEQGVDGETYHVGGPDRVSRYDFARYLCSVFDLDESLLIPMTMEEAGVDSWNPPDCSLDITKIRELGCIPPGLFQGFQEMKASGNEL